MAPTPARRQATAALLDAAEGLLVDVGHAGVTVRALAERAGVNQGLIHYYFGSMEEVLIQTLERFTERLIDRQIAMYAGDEPFVDKWRRAMTYLSEDFESGYQKIWLELQALAWNRPELRDRVAKVLERWVDVLRPAFATGMDELGIDRERMPVDAVVALVATFNQGVMVERLVGADSGHAPLLAWIDRWLTEQERARDASTRT